MGPSLYFDVKRRLSEGSKNKYLMGLSATGVALWLSSAASRSPAWHPLILVGSVCVSSWCAGTIAGLMTSIMSVVLFGIIYFAETNVVRTLCYLAVCAGLSWLIGTFRRRWDLIEGERDEMRIMLDYAPIGIALFGIDRKVLRCNPAFREIYGWDDEDIIGRTPPLPDSQRESWSELVEQLRAGKSFVNVETVRAQKDGRQFYARISGSPVFNNAGNLVGLVGFIAKADDGGHSDQLELRNLESLVQSSSDFMCVAQLDRKTFFLNDAGKDLVGLTYDAEIDETPLEVFFAEEDREHVLEMLDVLPTQRIGFTTQAVHLKHFQSGQALPVSCSFYVIIDPLTKEASSFACVAKSVEPANEWTPEASRVEEAFRALFRNAPVAIALVNTSGEPFESNEMFQQMFGYGADELRRMRFSQLVHPEDIPHGRKLFRSLASGQIDRYHVTKRLVARSGDVLWTKMTVALMRNSAGDPSYSISIVELISPPANHVA